MESITIPDRLVSRVFLFLVLILSYGQGFAISSSRNSYPKIYQALVNQEEYGSNTWFSACVDLYWILTILLVLGMRLKEHHKATPSLPSNHLLLKHMMEFGAAAGLTAILMRILTWSYVTIAFYAQLCCYMLLVFIILIVLNHSECLHFAVRKWRSYPYLSIIFKVYDTWIPMLMFVVLYKRKSRYIQPIELIV